MHCLVRITTLVLGAAPLSVFAGGVIPLEPWTVGPQQSCHFVRLQAALDAAATSAGAQTIRIAGGPYVEQALVINDANPVTLEGGYATCALAPAAEPTGITGTAGAAVIRVVGAGPVTLRRLHVSDGHGSNVPGGSGAHGGGVLHTGAGLLTVTDSVVSNNVASVGAGIAVVGGGSLVVSGGSMNDNTTAGGVSRGSAGIYFSSSGTLSLALLRMEGNTGRALSVATAGAVEVVDTHAIPGAAVAATGPAFDFDGPGPIVLDGATAGGFADGGLHYTGSGDLHLTGVTISTAGRLAGGLCSTTELPSGVVLAGSGEVSIEGSTIRDNCGRSGGGIRFDTGPSLYLERTRITGNEAGDGGGIDATRFNVPEVPVVRFGPDVFIGFNSAKLQGTSSGQGGGIRVAGVELDLTAAAGHRIAHNTANEGGGLWIDGGLTRIGSGAPDGNIVDNAASGSGGGLLVRGAATVELFTSDPDAPFALLRNRAGDFSGGGAMSLGGNPQGTTGLQRVYAWDVRIEDNVGGYAGGIYAAPDADLVLCIGRAADPASCEPLRIEMPALARSCGSGTACNVFLRNIANADIGAGAIFRQYGESSHIRVAGARFEGQGGRSLIASMPLGFLPQPRVSLDIVDSTMVGNTAAKALLDGMPFLPNDAPEELRYALGPVTIARSSIAGNVIGGTYVIGTRTGLTLHESIVYQPGIVVHAGNLSGVDARHVIANDVSVLPVRVDVIAADPRFVDADTGDLHLQPASPAIDFSDLGSGGLDLAGSARGYDRPDIVNRFGARDLGAYEMGGTLLLSDGFEP